MKIRCKDHWSWFVATLIVFLIIATLIGTLVLAEKTKSLVVVKSKTEWQCIAPVEDIGWATYCEVGDCHILFYGDEVRMECE